MRKENGRLRPADNKELSNKTGKFFECWECGHIEFIKNPDFGDMRCPKCLKGTLEEKIDQDF